LWQIEGVQGQESIGRVYPLGKSAAHLVGYIGKVTSEELEEMDANPFTENDMIGKRGLEQLYEETLRGEPGVKITVKTEDEEEVVIAEKKVKDGESIQITVDDNIKSEERRVGKECKARWGTTL